MGPVPVVAMPPGGELGSAFTGVLIGAGIGPFAQGGLDEALGLAVGPGHVGPGANVLEVEPATDVAKGEGSVAGAVVGHDALYFDAQACVVGDSGLEEGCGAGLLL